MKCNSGSMERPEQVNPYRQKVGQGLLGTEDNGELQVIGTGFPFEVINTMKSELHNSEYTKG